MRATNAELRWESYESWLQSSWSSPFTVWVNAYGSKSNAFWIDLLGTEKSLLFTCRLKLHGKKVESIIGLFFLPMKTRHDDAIMEFFRPFHLFHYWLAEIVHHDRGRFFVFVITTRRSCKTLGPNPSETVLSQFLLFKLITEPVKPSCVFSTKIGLLSFLFVFIATTFAFLLYRLM